MNKLKRKFTKLICAIFVAPSLPIKLLAKQDENKIKLNNYIKKIVGKRTLVTNTQVIKIKANPIYGSGDLVSLEVNVNYPMIGMNRITKMYILSSGNENIKIAEVFFSLYNTKAYFNTKIKLSKSAPIVVLIENNRNKIAQAIKYVYISDNA